MTLQDHNTINKLVTFYLEQHEDTNGRFWFSTKEGSINKEALHKLLIHNAIMGRDLDLNIY